MTLIQNILKNKNIVYPILVGLSLLYLASDYIFYTGENSILIILLVGSVNLYKMLLKK